MVFRAGSFPIEGSCVPSGRAEEGGQGQEEGGEGGERDAEVEQRAGGKGESERYEPW